MQIVVDYLTLTSKIHPLSFFIHALHLDDLEFVVSRARWGYETVFVYDNIITLYSGHYLNNRKEPPDDSICINLSGKGCRMVEEKSGLTFAWLQFFQDLEEDIKNEDVHISRLDIAADDFEGIVTYEKCYKAVMKKKYICRSKSLPLVKSLREEVIYFGSEKSERLMRIYNKALEQGYERGTFWTRVEFQFRDDSAISFLLNWFKIGSIGACYAGVVRDYLRFITKPVDSQHYSRAVIVSWWNEFLEYTGKLVQLHLQGNQYSMLSVENYLQRSCSSSIKTFLLSHNFSDLIKMVEKAPLSKKQEMLLTENGITGNRNRILTPEQRRILMAEKNTEEIRRRLEGFS